MFYKGIKFNNVQIKNLTAINDKKNQEAKNLQHGFRAFGSIAESGEASKRRLSIIRRDH